MATPLPPPGPTKLGFNTFAMWGLCAVVVGVCYYLEQNEVPQKQSARIPEDVQRVLPSGAWLMSDGVRLQRNRAHEPLSSEPASVLWQSIKKPPAAA